MSMQNESPRMREHLHIYHTPGLLSLSPLFLLLLLWLASFLSCGQKLSANFVFGYQQVAFVVCEGVSECV